jgi:hypothetical protein
VSHARAAIAGALVMLLGIWVMVNDQTAWETRDVLFAILGLLVVILLMLGIDLRRERYSARDVEREMEQREKEEDR